MKKIKVNLGDRSYYIYIGYNILPKLGNMLGRAKGIIITDDNVRKYWGRQIKSLGFPVYSVAPGERSKDLRTAEKIYKEMLKHGLDRHSVLVAFGGGVVGDLAGYTAATYMRGIRYVQVPTTVMAQVDSSIGGKTGVNLPHGKNLVGCFWQPEFVFMDTKLLTTLPEKEIRNGLAEVIKYGIIKDKGLFEYLEKKADGILNMNPGLWMQIAARCAKIKADVVSRDERETKGLRAILNYGHTIGHAIEASNRYKGITHGEAVARGMIAAAGLSNRLGYLSESEKNRQNNLINSLTLQNKHCLKCKVSGRLQYDKKAVGGRLRFILADKIGHVFVADNLRKKDIEAVLKNI